MGRSLIENEKNNLRYTWAGFTEDTECLSQARWK
jgi:hypothetical protein